MKIKLPILLSLFFIATITKSQNTNDTINFPYWINMMQDKNVNFYQTQRAFNLYWQNKTIEKGSGWKAFKRWEWMAERTIDSLGNFPDVISQLNQLNQMIKDDENRFKYRTFGLGPGSVSCKTQGDWKEFGPIFTPTNNTGQINGMGRLNAVAIHPKDTNIIFGGACAGGIWKTTNGGLTWSVYSDSLPTLGVSSIAFDPINPDTMYIGTGDRDAGDAAGFGVFKSTNGGKTWVMSNSGMGNRTVGRLIVSPRNPSIVLAATSNGVYRSTNYGSTWTLISTATGNFKDIIFKPNNHNVVYATRDGFLFRSTDNGVSFSSINTGLPTTSVSRGVIDVNENMPNLVYFWLANGSVNRGFYLSRDSGTTFRTQSTTPNLHDYSTNGSGTGGQAWYDKDMVTDPSNPAIIYVGGVNIFRSNDTGRTWTIAGYWVNKIHADQHELISCARTKRIFSANDGGLYFTRDRGVNWIPVKSGLAVAQIYKMDCSRTQKDILINGYQDNGTGNFNKGWFTTRGGDGMDCAIDQTDNRYSYGELYYGSIFRVFGVNTQATIAANGTNGINEDGAWVTPLTLREGSGNTMYVGYKNIWRSNNIRNNPPTWTRISNNLGGTNTSNFNKVESNIANSDILYAGRSNGTLYRSDDINATTPTWTSITQPISGVVNAIETDPKIQNAVYIGIGTRVYRSLNRGGTWTQVASNLSHNVNCILLDTSNSKKGIYVGTNGGGIWYTDTTINFWKYYAKGLPHSVRVTDIKLYYDNSKQCKNHILYASTYNRGNWFGPVLNDGVDKPIARINAYDSVLCFKSTLNLTSDACNVPGRYKWEFSSNQYQFVNGTDTFRRNVSVKFNSKGNVSFKFMAENCVGIDTLIGSVLIGDTVISPTCIPTTTNSFAGLGIYKVTMNGAENISGGRVPEGGFVDFSCGKVFKVKRGKKYLLNVETGALNSEQVKAFIDFNNDGDFTDAGELVYQPAAALLNHSDTITIPLNSTINKIIRFRIRSDFSSLGTNPCSDLNYGQTEDYGIIIVDSIVPKFETNKAIVCKDNQLLFSDSTESLGFSYLWDFGSGAMPATSNTKGPHSVKYNSPGYKKISLTIDGFKTIKDSFVMVSEVPNTALSFTLGDSSLCEKESFKLSTNDLNNTATNFKWLINSIVNTDSISKTFSKQNVSLHDSGTYQIIASNQYCSDTSTRIIKINPHPLVNFNINDSNQCLSGNVFQMTNISSIMSGNMNYNWNFSDLTQSTLQNPNKTYSTFGTYNISLIANSNFQCIDSMSKWIIVNENANLDFTFNQNSACYNSHEMAINNLTSISNGTFNTLWNYRDGTFDTAFQTAAKRYSNYSLNNAVKLKVITNLGCADSLTKNYTLLASPSASFNVNSFNQCLSDNQFNFINTSTIANGSFNSLWNFGDLSSATNMSPTKIYTKDSVYDVSLIVTSNMGCKDTIIQQVNVLPMPQVVISTSDTLRCLLDNTFTLNSNSKIKSGSLSNIWKFGNGDTSSQKTVTKVYLNQGTYTLKLIEQSNLGCIDSASKLLYVKPNANTNFSITLNNQCFKNNAFNFNNLSSISNGTFNSLWHFGNGNNSSVNNPSGIKYSSFNDSFIVKLVTTSIFQCKDSIQKTAYLRPSPIVSFAINDSSQCKNQNKFRFTNSSSVVSGTLLNNWTFGDGIISTLTNPIHDYDSVKNYLVKLKVSTNKMCVDSLIKTVIVLPSTKVNFQINNSAQCFKGHQFSLTDNSVLNSGTYTNVWEMGDASVKNGTTITHKYLNPGNYTIKLITNTQLNCKDTFASIVNVFVSPKAKIQINDSDQCLLANDFQLNDISTKATVAIREWKLMPNTVIGNATQLDYTFTNVGDYKIQLIVETNQFCRDTVLQNVKVVPSPEFTVSGAVKYCQKEPIRLEAISTDPNNTYNWQIPNEISFNGNPFNSIANTLGNKSVQCIATNAFGCQTTLNLKNRIAVYPKPVPIIDTSVQMVNNNLVAEFYDITPIAIKVRSWNTSPLSGVLGGASNPNRLSVTISDSVTLTVALTLTDTNNCSGTTMRKFFFIVPNNYYFPNTFSPNEDGINDQFNIVGFSKVKEFEMMIFNRWGELIFKTNDPVNGWNGKSKGEDVPIGDYMYTIKLKDLNSRIIIKKGMLTLLR
jgi:gliding motility-associated-like protein